MAKNFHEGVDGDGCNLGKGMTTTTCDLCLWKMAGPEFTPDYHGEEGFARWKEHSPASNVAWAP